MQMGSLRKMGNSRGLILPKVMLDELGVPVDAQFELRVENGEFIARPVKRKVREGWAEAAREIGALPPTQEEQDWLDFDDPIEGEIPAEWLVSDDER